MHAAWFGQLDDKYIMLLNSYIFSPFWNVRILTFLVFKYRTKCNDNHQFCWTSVILITCPYSGAPHTCRRKNSPLGVNHSLAKLGQNTHSSIYISMQTISRAGTKNSNDRLRSLSRGLVQVQTRISHTNHYLDYVPRPDTRQVLLHTLQHLSRPL